MSEASALVHLDWQPEALRRALGEVLPGIEVEVRSQVDSTNTRLIEALRADPRPVARLLVAEDQTAGRGRAGRRWHSLPGDSLTFSLALALAPRDWSGLSLAVGVALADALEPRVGGTAGQAGARPPALGIKWPNDLWRVEPGGRGRKLGGILIETVPVEGGRAVVIGVGLNVRPIADEGFDTGVGSVHEFDPAATAPTVLARAVVPLAQAVRRFEREGLAPFAEAYAARDLLRGRHVSTTSNPAAQGLALGICEDGALRLQTAEGRELRITAGDVSVRLGEVVPC